MSLAQMAKMKGGFDIDETKEPFKLESAFILFECVFICVVLLVCRREPDHPQGPTGRHRRRCRVRSLIFPLRCFGLLRLS